MIPFCRYLSSLMLVLVCTGGALAGGGPLGIDHILSYDNSGIWKRSNQTTLVNVLIGGEIAGAICEGGETRLGPALWQAIDPAASGAVASEALNQRSPRA